MDTNDQSHTEPPLWSIGIVIVVILLAPLVLYSFSPTGPVREGDTVFSEGQQHVRINKPAPSRPHHPDDTCLLDPNSPLIVVRSPGDPADNSLIAHVQGNLSDEWPFCPVHTEILLYNHQVFQKPAWLETVRELLTRLVGR